MPLKLETKLPQGGIPVLSLKDYLSQNRTLVIPPWQREYSWKTTEDYQVDTLMKDLLHFLRNPNSEEYLIGSVVLCELENDSGRPLLIDGQQRTLTLTLLLMCCQKYLKTYGDLNNSNLEDAQLVTDIASCITGNPLKALQARVEMKRRDADLTLEELYNWSLISGDYDKSIFKNMDKKNDTQKNLIATAEFIYKEIAGTQREGKNGVITGKPGNWLTPNEMKSAMVKLLNKVKVIEIKVDEKRESISVFDHINNRGMALNPADLVKNLMFESVKDTEFDKISDNWEDMSELLMATKKSRLADPRFLLRAISHVEYGAHESYDNMSVFWAKKFQDYQNGSEKGVAPLDFSKKLPEYASDLKALALRDKEFKYHLSDIYLSGELGSIQHYSVLLAGTHFTNKETYSLLARQVNLRTLLYMFANEKTQSFDAMIPDWAFKVFKLPENATKQELTKVYTDCAKPDEKLFASLRENMAEWDYTNASSKKKIRSTLALLSIELNLQCNQGVKIENAMRAKKKQGEDAPWEIEHVLPQAMFKENIYHGLGNLVLLSSADNNNASNKPPAEKKNHYSQSQLIVTKTLSGLDFANTKQSEVVSALFSNLDVNADSWNLNEWSEKSVEARLDFYFKYLSHIIKSAGQ
jgi:uncharacterized protein with ParB-like and HNH nuclease domain